jgi:catechol 2,3-dioxygenase-like lactoylglutathione lyase family enzyme
MALNIGQIRHVGLFTPSLSDHARFYTDVWGLQTVAKSKDSIAFRGVSPQYFVLSLHSRPAKGLHHIGYTMADREAVQRAADALVRAGVRMVSGPKELDEPGAGFGLRFLDPDGRCIELSAEVETHSQGWANKIIEPDSVCHVVLNTPDIKNITNFYTNVLGFRVSDWSGEQMVFLRTDSKHHNISFSASSHAAVNHIAFLVSSIDQVMSSVSHMRKNGFEAAWGPGRHGPGNNVFCYYKDPMGYVVEYTSDIDQIKDDARHEPKVWPRSPESMDRWGLAAPPTPELREAMAGEPDPGWAA